MFITFEGMEGCGKTTQIQKLALLFFEQAQETVCTREPGGSSLGCELRQILLHPKNTGLNSMSELFLYLADRAQHVSSVIKPALEQGKIVISDRFADSTIVYQGYGRGLNTDMLLRLNNEAVHGLWPDLTFLLDLEPEIGLKRAQKRDIINNKHHVEGRFEMEKLEFHKRVRDGYLAWAAQHPERFVVLDASPAPNEIFTHVQKALHNFWPAQITS